MEGGGGETYIKQKKPNRDRVNVVKYGMQFRRWDFKSISFSFYLLCNGNIRGELNKGGRKKNKLIGDMSPYLLTPPPQSL